MRVPQVSERIKEAPAQALRGVFAGIGQLLLITDKIRNKASYQDVARARTPRAPETVTDTAVTSPAGQDAGTAAAAQVKPAAPAKPAAAEPAPAEPAPAEPVRAEAAPAEAAPAEPAAGKPPTARRTPAKAAAAESAAAAGDTPPRRQSTRDFDKTGNVRLLADDTAVPAAAAAAADQAPLPNYDELSVASLRARLRNLDVSQVGQLAEYERAHAARAEVLTMFERRIAKLEAEA
jgi:hypothetical protein